MHPKREAAIGLFLTREPAHQSTTCLLIGGHQFELGRKDKTMILDGSTLYKAKMLYVDFVSPGIGAVDVAKG